MLTWWIILVAFFFFFLNQLWILVTVHDPCGSNENAPCRFPTPKIIIDHKFQLLHFKIYCRICAKPMSATGRSLPMTKIQGDVKTDQFLGVTGLWSFNIGSNTHRQLWRTCLRPLSSLKFFFPTFPLFLLHKVRGASPTDYSPSLLWLTFYFFHSRIFF